MTRKTSTISARSGVKNNTAPARTKSLVPMRKHTSKTMVEKLVDKTFGEQNKEKMF